MTSCQPFESMIRDDEHSVSESLAEQAEEYMRFEALYDNYCSSLWISGQNEDFEDSLIRDAESAGCDTLSQLAEEYERFPAHDVEFYADYFADWLEEHRLEEAFERQLDAYNTCRRPEDGDCSPSVQHSTSRLVKISVNDDEVDMM